MMGEITGSSNARIASISWCSRRMAPAARAQSLFHRREDLVYPIRLASIRDVLPTEAKRPRVACVGVAISLAFTPIEGLQAIGGRAGDDVAACVLQGGAGLGH